ncbi:hypothetical protein BJ741DRAFT_520140, partial [Chytriomyces cf. hyalinus JEL632]
VELMGSFDNWTKSLNMAKKFNYETGATDFTVRVAMDDMNPGDKVLFKFKVDGEWRTSSDFPVEVDASGFENNAFRVP